jgi:hypothetical protein
LAIFTKVYKHLLAIVTVAVAEKSEKKKASCGGPAMRKRLLIKNFVTQMLDQEKQMNMSREQLVSQFALQQHLI